MNGNSTRPDDAVSIVSGGPEWLDRVEPLWLELRRHHAELAPLWREQFVTATFDARKSGLLEKAGKGLLVLLAVTGEEAVGYCVCTLASNGWGEVDSLYVAPQYRRRGVGRALVTAGMAWLGERGAKPIVVDVLAANDEARRLYERFGFHARTVRLCHVPGTVTP